MKCKLKDIAVINMGQSPKGETYNANGNGTPFLQGRKTFGRLYPSIDTWTTTPIKIAEKNSILMSVRAPVGDMNFANQEVCIGRGLCSINALNGNNKYLYYMLLANIKKLTQKSSGTVFDSVNKNDLENLEIDVFDDVTQNKIEVILGNIDRKIELNNAINNNLYDLTNKLYEDLFVKNRDELWHEYNLLELADFINGYSYTGKELVEESNIGMATIKNFERTGGFKEDGFKPLNPVKSKEQHEAKLFDILVACTDLTQNADIIGNAVMLLNTNNYDKVVISMDLVKVLPKNNHFMIYSILNSREFKNHALGYKSGTTVLHLNKDCFKDFNIKLPKQDIIDKFQSVAEANYKKISANLKENKTLEQLRNTLLPKLMNGEIDLDSVEI